MNKTIFLLLLTFAKVALCQEKMEIDGAIIIKNSEDLTPEPGTIRYNLTTSDFEGWNGVFWASLTGFEIGSVTDIDGNIYPTIIIGAQEWMAQNLRASKYRNDDAIPNVTDDTDWSNLNTGAFAWYDNDNNFEQPYGKLYNWYAVNDGRGLCPTGWHVPSDSEWTILTDTLGGIGFAGGRLKEVSQVRWSFPNEGATNKSGFTGIPGGYRQNGNGSFTSFRFTGHWWSSTEVSSDAAWARILRYNDVRASRNLIFKKDGYSVRCIRD